MTMTVVTTDTAATRAPAHTVPAAGPAAGQAAAAARLFGAAEALWVCSGRSASERQRAYRYAMRLLATRAVPADWDAAGLPMPRPLAAHPAAGQPAPGLPTPSRTAVGHPAVLRLAVTAMRLQCTSLGMAERVRCWERLYDFFAARLPAADGQLTRLREALLGARIDIGDGPPPVVDGLRAALAQHIDADGHDAYLTGLARANLAVAYLQRAQDGDVAEAIRLTWAEAQSRSDRYGPTHPVTLVALSLHVRALLQQAELTTDAGERKRLAAQALAANDDIRVSRDRQYGVLALNAIRSRKREGHALLLLGEDLGRAAACLQYALAFETARNDNREWRGSGTTHLLLARVHAASGDLEYALRHAEMACRLLSQHSPTGPSYRKARQLRDQIQQDRRQLPPDGDLLGPAGESVRT